jgi:hypothetical protein
MRHVLSLGLLLAASPAPAQLHFAEPVVHVGTVYSGQPLVRKFPFVNVGKEPVDIINIKGSCACAVPRLAKRQFAPGEEGVVEFEVHTLGQPAGPSAWGLTLTCQSGPTVTAIPLRIQAELITEVRCEPAALQLLVRDGLTATLTIHWKSSLFPRLQAVRTSAAPLQATIEPGPSCDLGGSTQRVRVAVADDYPEGRHEEIVSIYTDNPAYAELKVPVTIVKASRQRVSATPGRIMLAAPAGQPVPSRVVLLRDADNQAVQIEKITADHPALSGSWAPGPGELATLKVRVDAAVLPPAGLRSAVHVELRQPVPETLTIPVEVRREP